MKFLMVDYKKFNSRRKFGVELEIGNSVTKTRIQSLINDMSDRHTIVTKYQPSTENGYWHVKNDATCGPQGRSGPNGVEIASYVASGIEDLQHIAAIATSLSDIGCEVNENCGMHIHVDASDLTIAQVGVLMAYWIKIEQCLEQSLPLRRRDNEYCKRVGSRLLVPQYYAALTTAENFYRTIRPSNLGYFENEDRRVTLNIVNYVRACLYKNNIRKTLELRWPEGTLNASDIKCWTRLFISFVESCKNRPFPTSFSKASLEDTLLYLGLNHEGQTFTIFSEGLLETKTWLLERFIEHSTEYRKEAKNILNIMWSPEKKYA